MVYIYHIVFNPSISWWSPRLIHNSLAIVKSAPRNMGVQVSLWYIDLTPDIWPKVVWQAQKAGISLGFLLFSFWQ
jgi:hypothetical protein